MLLNLCENFSVLNSVKEDVISDVLSEVVVLIFGSVVELELPPKFLKPSVNDAASPTAPIRILGNLK